MPDPTISRPADEPTRLQRLARRGCGGLACAIVIDDELPSNAEDALAVNPAVAAVGELERERPALGHALARRSPAGHPGRARARPPWCAHGSSERRRARLGGRATGRSIPEPGAAAAPEGSGGEVSVRGHTRKGGELRSTRTAASGLPREGVQWISRLPAMTKRTPTVVASARGAHRIGRVLATPERTRQAFVAGRGSGRPNPHDAERTRRSPELRACLGRARRMMSERTRRPPRGRGLIATWRSCAGESST
jgi:hypothetical protein